MLWPIYNKEEPDRGLIEFVFLHKNKLHTFHVKYRNKFELLKVYKIILYINLSKLLAKEDLGFFF